MWLSRKVHNLAHCIVSSKVAAVRASAPEWGGTCSWKFSQVENPVRSLMCSIDDTSIGICELLSAKWIERSVKGSSLAAWLEGSNAIDPNKVRMLMQYYAIGATMKPGMIISDTSDTRAPQQDLATRLFLETQGVVRQVGSVVRGGATFKDVEVESDDVWRKGNKRRFHAAALAEAIAERPNTWKTVGIQGPKFAHACAASTVRNEVRWFDPNFGEFQFGFGIGFRSWFPKYWHLAGYGTPKIGYSEMFKVREFVGAGGL